MRALRIATLLVLWPLFSLAAAGAAPLSLTQYIATLQQLKQAVSSAQDGNAASAIAQGLPSEWDVAADGRQFAVPTGGLRQRLEEYAKQHTPANRDVITAQLTLLLADAEKMSPAQANFTAERNRLDEILSRHEFHNVKGESWWDKLKRAVQRWLWRLFQRLLGSSAYPVVSRFVIWGLLVLAVAVACLWMVRLYREKAIYTQFTGAPEAVSAKPWRDWQAEAQAAAHEGRWRDAVHLLYWAGISFLEGQGLWRPDRARTPREYLRLLPTGDLHRDPLQQLTRSFEKVWYGNDAATAETFAGASALLERLGCR